MTWQTFLIALYSLSGATSCLGYAPQIARVWKDKTGAESISLIAWSWWTLTTFISILYATLIIGNLPLICVAAGNFLGCFLTVMATLWRRRSLAAA